MAQPDLEDVSLAALIGELRALRKEIAELRAERRRGDEVIHRDLREMVKAAQGPIAAVRARRAA
ncbi:MAG: hypothetical protein WA975_23525 [Mesorhizobium sp.]